MIQIIHNLYVGFSKITRTMIIDSTELLLSVLDSDSPALKAQGVV